MFGPPEVITGRLMSGAGAAPMLAASGEFTAAAAAYEASIDQLVAQLAFLSASWQGEASMAMQRAVFTFIVWMRVMQAQVMLAATRTGSQAAAFTEAYTTMAQMAEIVENRVTTAILYMTNFLGFNTIPIGVREGQYTEMWLRDVSVQTNYLAQTMANTTFEKFVPPMPITGVTSFPPVIDQALNAATAAGDSVRMAAIKADNIAGSLQAQVGQLSAVATLMAQNGTDAAQKSEAQSAVARHKGDEGTQDATQNMGEQMTQQLVQQIPQQAASLGQQAVQLPQQALQQVQQVGQQAGQQFGSQISNLMSQVSPEHRLDNPGFFDTQPSSPTLDRLAGSSGSGAMINAVRVPNLAGLSGINTGFRFPGGWDGPPAMSAPPSMPATPGGSGSAITRPMNGMLHGRRKDDEEDRKIKRPDTELFPIWGDEPDEGESVSAGALVTQRQEQEAGT
jgi:PPE-repeat protein